MNSLYFDYAATTPLDPAVLSAMNPFWQKDFANPSGLYYASQRTASALRQARHTIAAILGVSAADIYFTGSATESNNWALKGVLWNRARLSHRKILAIGPAEHSSIKNAAKALKERFQTPTLFLPGNRYGQVDRSQLAELPWADIALVSLSYASSEIGSLQPLSEVAAYTQKHLIPLHIDATQAPNGGKLKEIAALADLLTLSSHKIYGPRGIGLLYIKTGTTIDSLLDGGEQENAMRAGTENIPAIVGLAKAVELTQEPRYLEHLQKISQLFQALLAENLPELKLTGHPTDRLPAIFSFIVPGWVSYDLLVSLDMAGLSASAGSACYQGKTEPLEVLLKAGYSQEQARSSLRLSFGQETTPEDLQECIKILKKVIFNHP